MLNPSRPSCVWTVLLCLLGAFAGSTAKGQTPTTLDRHLSLSASNTLGALVTLRYTKSPYIGAEFNYGYARYTENFSQYVIGGAQTKASEYTVGYVAHPPKLLFGVHPFVAGGLGAIAFRPT